MIFPVPRPRIPIMASNDHGSARQKFSNGSPDLGTTNSRHSVSSRPRSRVRLVQRCRWRMRTRVCHSYAQQQQQRGRHGARRCGAWCACVSRVVWAGALLTSTRSTVGRAVRPSSCIYPARKELTNENSPSSYLHAWGAGGGGAPPRAPPSCARPALTDQSESTYSRNLPRAVLTTYNNHAWSWTE